MTIGQFSAFTRLSVRMLRYYDEHGVLTAAHVDPDTRYRYYTAAQMAPAALLRSLRDIGFSVAAIAAVLPHSDDPATLRRALESHRHQLQAEAANLHRRLADLERLVTSLKEKAMPTIDRRTLPAHSIIALRDHLPTYEDEGALWERLMPAVFAAGTVPTGAGSTYHDEEYRETDVDVEVWCIVPDAVPVASPFEFRAVPEQDVIGTTVTGPYSELATAFAQVGAALAEQGVAEAGPMFCRFLVGPGQTQNPDEYVTEVFIPVA